MKYRTIVADPPWPYDRVPATRPSGKDKRVVPGPLLNEPLSYPTMTVAAIVRLPIVDNADTSCRLFLWTTNRFLPDALALFGTWCFTYRQTLVWHKYDGGPFAASVAVNTAEFLVVGTRGKPGRTGYLPSSVIKIPAPRVHSTKPEAFLDYIEQVSPGPYLELFARRNRLGWDTWGGESLEHVTIAGTPSQEAIG